MNQQSSLQQVQVSEEFFPTNRSGLTPLGRAVLIRPYDPEADRVKGIIHIPDDVRRNMNMADQRAIVVAVGPDAWRGETARAVPGDKVLVGRFAGYFAPPSQTKDGLMYRLVNDNEIFCRIE
ncbi:MAG TPA: hypothetical protein VF077_08830 [Nitrospiraceae bacterium]